MNITAPGKINLALEVLRKRPDGFHEIRSLMVSVGLEDDLHITPTDGDAITLTCDAPGMPCDESNLIHRAASLLRKRTGVVRGCDIHLTKRIPMGAGMGGGSSDAAATMRALNKLWQLGLDTKQLVTVAADIGSDVPFFFSPSGAIASGRGELIEPVELAWSGWVGLVYSGDHVSTPAVYQRCKPNADASSPQALMQLAQCKSGEDMGPRLRNDLEAGVFEVSPNVRTLRDTLIESGIANDTLRVTGAGSVLFQLFDDEGAASAFVSDARSCPSVASAWVAKVPASPRIPG